MDYFPIKCEHWTNSDKFFRGVCALGLFKGHPSYGDCVHNCGKCTNTVEEFNAYISTLPKGPASGKESEKPCGGCHKLGNIAKGIGQMAAQYILGAKPDEWAIERLAICSTCEKRTFLPLYMWAAKGIDLAKVVKLEGVFADAELPIDHEPGPWSVLWCAVCKCSLKAKASVADESCPINKWGKHTDEKPKEIEGS